jgi:hypothetical protein
MLAAVFPRGDEKWFFKLTGDPEVVGQHQEEFDHFLDSVRFTTKPDDPIVWQEPKGWVKGPKTQFSFASFRVGDGDAAPALTVTRAGGDLLENVNRWRGQLGLDPLKQSGLADALKERKIGDATALVVDMTGVTAAKSAGKPPFAGGMPPITERRPPAERKATFKYTRPAGWREGDELVKAGIRREAVLLAGTGADQVETTVTLAGGPPIANVNRWRGQVGLDPLTAEQVIEQSTPLDVQGSKTLYVDVNNPADPKRPRILGVLMLKGDQTCFFKMTGPPEAVGREKAAFEAFVKSARFEGGADE